MKSLLILSMVCVVACLIAGIFDFYYHRVNWNTGVLFFAAGLNFGIILMKLGREEL